MRKQGGVCKEAAIGANNGNALVLRVSRRIYFLLEPRLFLNKLHRAHA